MSCRARAIQLSNARLSLQKRVQTRLQNYEERVRRNRRIIASITVPNERDVWRVVEEEIVRWCRLGTYCVYNFIKAKKVRVCLVYFLSASGLAALENSRLVGVVLGSQWQYTPVLEGSLCA
jgi:hypothetical protein